MRWMQFLISGAALALLLSACETPTTPGTDSPGTRSPVVPGAEQPVGADPSLTVSQGQVIIRPKPLKGNAAADMLCVYSGRSDGYTGEIQLNFPALASSLGVSAQEQGGSAVAMTVGGQPTSLTVTFNLQGDQPSAKLSGTALANSPPVEVAVLSTTTSLTQPQVTYEENPQSPGAGRSGLLRCMVGHCQVILRLE